MKDKSDMAKVLFRIPEEDGSANIETLWATALGEDRYQLNNSPFYAYSVSWNDIVYAPISPEEERPTFVRVLEKSGHKTIRVIFESPAIESGESEKLLKQLVALGCSYEGANPSYICIDIPPIIELEPIRQFMLNNELQFEHADPSYEELYPDETD